MLGPRIGGFTLIELAVVLAIMAILILAGLPSFGVWMANARIRTLAETLQNDLRKAQGEAIKGNRQVAFVLTNSSPTTGSITSNPANPGRNWAIYAVPLLNSADASDANFVPLVATNIQPNNSDTTVASATTIICFNSVGRLVTQNTPIANAGGATCSAPTTTAPIAFNVGNNIGDRPMRVQVNLGGQIRMCDPNKSISTSPDGC